MLKSISQQTIPHQTKRTLKKYLTMLLAVALILSNLFIPSEVAKAATSTVSGTLLPDNTFNRPQTPADTGGGSYDELFNSSKVLSVTPTIFNYFTRDLIVSVTGNYTFSVTSASFDISGSPSTDTFVIIYDGSFDPSQPLNNLYYCNDDNSAGLDDEYYSYLPSIPLDSTHTYTLVLTSFGAGAEGPLSLAIQGPGTVTAAANSNSSDALTITGSVGASGAGATISYGSQSATADGSGNYSITVTTGWSGTVTPTLTGYTFSPASRDYTSLSASSSGQDYTASPEDPGSPTQITAFDAINNVNAGSAGSATYANASAVISALPTIVKANNNTVSVPVTTWVDTDDYNPNVAGSYTFTATLGTIPTGYANAGGYTATVEVVVGAMTYTVTYHANGGSGTAPVDNNSYLQGVSVTLPSAGGLSLANHNFGGWAQSASGSAISGATYTMGNSNVTLYAVWVADATYTIVYHANGGSGTAPVDNNSYLQGASVTLPGAGGLSLANHSFGGWAQSVSGSAISGTTYTMGNSNTTLYAVWTSTPTPPSEQPTSTAPTVAPAPTPDVRQVEVNGAKGNDANSVATVDITRETINNKKVDSVVLDQKKTEEVIQKVLQQNQNTVQIIVSDIPDNNADEVTVTVDKSSVQKLSQGNVALEVKTDDVIIKLPEDTLKNMSDNLDDLYFRVIPIRNEAEKEQTVENAITAEVVQTAAGNSQVIALGTPMTIETNYQNFATKVVFSLKNITIPTDPEQKAALLDSLGVYIKHSDGTQELNRGKVIYDAAGNPVGLEIEISKFSTFTIVSIKNAPPTATKVKLTGTAVAGKELRLSYVYTDTDGDKEGKSLITWYRADNKDGKNKVPLQKGSTPTYKIAKKDQGKYIYVELTPIAMLGETNGITVTAAVKIKESVSVPTIQLNAHIRLGLIGSESYAKKVAGIIEKNYNSYNVVLKPEGKYYRITFDFVDAATAKAACEDLKAKKYIINYYFYKK